ncbi:MAG TPA: hypothetical protein VF247_10005 [Candidatus Krumholzibacteria bacterium]
MPDDEVMIGRFTQNRAAFEHLLKSAQMRDGFYASSDDNQREIMEQLAVREIYNTGQSVRFVCTGIEHEFNGEKGYLFVRLEGGLPPWMAGKVVSKLDDVYLGSSEIRYKELGEGWFLYLQEVTD